MNNSFYSVEIDSVAKEQWHNIIIDFRDCTINQTWDFGAALAGERNLSHIVVRRQEKVCAAVQVRTRLVPVLGGGLAYVIGGPLWRKEGNDSELCDLGVALRFLREEYIIKRKMMLFIRPNIYTNDPKVEDLRALFRENGYRHQNSAQKTMIINLDAPIATLRKGLDQKWRNCLNKSERQGLELLEGDDESLFRSFKTLYLEMISRKKYENPVDIDRFGRAYLAITSRLRPRIVLCKFQGSTVAGGIFNVTGDTGTYLLGATNDLALKSCASYLLQWRIITWLKENGHLTYDLGGTDKLKAPGPYTFKVGLTGRNGMEVHRIGEYTSLGKSVGSFLVSMLLKAREMQSKIVSHSKYKREHKA
jgi:hypothetical protein